MKPLFRFFPVCLCLALLCPLFCGCAGEKKEDPTLFPASLTGERVTSPAPPPKSEKKETAETSGPPPAAPRAVYPVGVYVQNGGYSRVSSFTSRWPEGENDPLWRRDTWTYPGKTNLICDVGYFVVLPSNEEHPVLPGAWDAAFLAEWEKAGLAGMKTGFSLEAVKKDGTVLSSTVLSPEDTFSLEEYFELYLYDDVAHAHDAWYSHVTPAEFGEATRLTSIKITLREGCRDLKEIVLTAFYYKDESDFDAEGRYTGSNKASCVVSPS